MNPKIKQLLETCKAAAPSCVFKIYDSEAFVIKTADISAALAAMDGGDDVAEITVKDGKTVLGWFACMPYGDEDEAIFDHADNDFCDTVCKRIEAAKNSENN
jgi:hypothetical protein